MDEADFATHTPPQRETSCSQLDPEPNRTAQCSAAHAPGEKCAASDHPAESRSTPSPRMQPCEELARSHAWTQRDSTPTPTTLSGTICSVAARCQACSRGRCAGCCFESTLKGCRALQRVERFARDLQSALQKTRLQCRLIVGICVRGRVERGAFLRSRLALYFGKAKRCHGKCSSGGATCPPQRARGRKSGLALSFDPVPRLVTLVF